MNHVCPMCGHAFSVENDFAPSGPVICPSCGTQVGGAVLSPAGDADAAARKVQAPAVALMVVGGLTVGVGFVNLAIASLVAVTEQDRPEEAAAAAIVYGIAAVLSFATGAFVAFGGWRMYQLRSWGLALAASIVSVIPCLVCFLFGVPVGIWSMVTLNDPDVKGAFA